MTVSIYTPTNNPRWLREAYTSIKDQPFDEWVVCYNNGAKPIGLSKDDGRVVEVVNDETVCPPNVVGAAKRRAVELCHGDILVELDHDDLLLPGAIEAIKAAYSSDDIGFVYSDSVYFKDGDSGPDSSAFDPEGVGQFSPAYGWQYYDHEWMGKAFSVAKSFAPTPASVSRIWFAPDHVRTFRRSAYDAAGGYDPTLKALDDQDLMCRLYQHTKFKQINAPLYAYRVRGDSTCHSAENNAWIQANVMTLYNKYIEPMAIKWARDRGLMTVDLGGRLNSAPVYTTVDLRDASVIADLNVRWPFGDGTVGVVRAFDVFEHLRNPIHTMQELYRVLAPGGYAFIQIPSTDGRGAFQDPTHVSFWNENSFLYYTDSRWNRYIDCPVRFQALRRYTTEKNDIGVCWVVAHLHKTDPAIRTPGEVFFDTKMPIKTA